MMPDAVAGVDVQGIAYKMLMEGNTIQEILKVLGGCTFGSRAWGCETELSDLDIVIPLAVAESVKTILINLNFEVTQAKYYTSGYYVKDKDGMVINVTGCKEKDFLAWKTASEMMKNANCKKLISPEARKSLFEILLGHLKYSFIVE